MGMGTGKIRLSFFTFQDKVYPTLRFQNPQQWFAGASL